MKDLSNYRKSYDKNELLESTIPNNPMELFNTWFQEVENSKTVEEANAMTISTIGLDGFPKSRVVLLKQYNEDGFTFYTNYDSQKGKAIEANPKICLSFFWPSIEQQVIIKGEAKKVSSLISDTYFASRPKGSQLGAAVSNQSSVIDSREVLVEKLKELEGKYENTAIERPENWGGYIVVPHEIEFWQGRPNRLHDRISYKLQEKNTWKIERLSP